MGETQYRSNLEVDLGKLRRALRAPCPGLRGDATLRGKTIELSRQSDNKISEPSLESQTNRTVSDPAANGVRVGTAKRAQLGLPA